MWKVITIWLVQTPDYFAMRLLNITSLYGYHYYTATTDASPTGVGIAFSDAYGQLLWHISYVYPFSVRESKYQNAREYLAVLVLYIMMKVQGFRDVKVKWINDNMSALSWMHQDYCASDNVQYTFLTISWLAMINKIQIPSVQHIPGITMGDVDRLSRSLDTSYDPQLDMSHLLHTDSIHQLILKCDPSTLDNQFTWENMMIMIQLIFAI